MLRVHVVAIKTGIFKVWKFSRRSRHVSYSEAVELLDNGSMTPERWRKVEELYYAAREQAVDHRAAFLAGACRGDADLRHEVESLLARDCSVADILDHPAWEVSPSLINDPTRTALVPGMQLGPYKIEAILGSGGMGQVYKARDTRLDRSVAIKILSQQFSGRFEREARAISALNHPHICTLHDVGPNYLVMELVEGETLASRLKKGALPLQQVLEYGAQIADALAAAHAKGIIHRDLKPGNIMLTKTGVKVLDFGLAKSHQDETMTATQAVMGTPAYMAPEQQDGKECDARTDIYALGLVLREMSTADRVPRDQPLQLAGLPPQLLRVIETCLAPEPGDRWQSSHDLGRVLRWIGQKDRAETRSVARWVWPLALGVASAAFLVLVLVGIRFLKPAPSSTQILRLTVPLPGNPNLGDSMGGPGPPAISPDGKMLVVSASTGPNVYLWLRYLDSDRFERLPGTEGAFRPFWSPDSRQIGFFAGDKLKKVPSAGGTVQTLCSVPPGTEGGTWNSLGTILYAINSLGLFRVSERGGEPVLIHGVNGRLGEGPPRNPAFLKDGKRFIYFSRTADEEKRGIYLDNLDTAGNRPPRKLTTADQQALPARDPSNGDEYLLLIRTGKLWAQRFDSEREELIDDPVAVADNVGLFSSSDAGSIVVQSGNSEEVRFTWFDRDGRELGIVGPSVPSNYGLEISPNGHYIAFLNHRSLDGHFSVWLLDLSREVALPFSVQTVRSFAPIWSRDSGRVYFFSDRDGANAIFSKAVDDAGAEQLLIRLTARYILLDQSPDSKFMLADQRPIEAGSKRSLVYASAGKNDWRNLMEANGVDGHGQYSPDGRWVAYDSDESGAWEVYITDFPGGRHKYRLSIAGGREPRWRQDGKELLYYSPDGALVSVDVSKSVDFGTAKPRRLFGIRFDTPALGYHYSLSRDGERIMALKEVSYESSSRDLHIVLGWPQLFRRQSTR